MDMNYEFRFAFILNKIDIINEIVDICKRLNASEKTTIYEYGENRDLVLHIYKDEDFKEGNEYNLVRVYTFQNGSCVDDTEDLYVNDGQLENELQRIWNYESFSTL